MKSAHTQTLATFHNDSRECLRAQLVCQFGEPPRGLSPYGDALLENLEKCGKIRIDKVDYEAAYPGLLHPASGGGAQGQGRLHWAKPWTWKHVAEGPAHVLHIQHWSAPLAYYLWPLAALARRAGKGVIVTVHNPEAHENLSLGTKAELKLLRVAHRIIVHDKTGAAILRERSRMITDAIRIIPHGIRVVDIPAPPTRCDFKSLGLDPERRHVITFGNLRGYKGITLLLEAWSQLAPRMPGVDLVIAGRLWSGSQNYGARTIAKLLGTDRDAQELKIRLSTSHLNGRVHLREGFLSDHALDALLRIGEVAVFPYTRFASQSGAACRAAGTGCPVLVSDLGALPELAIDKSWIFDSGNLASLEQTLRTKLTDGPINANNRLLQVNRVRQYDWSGIAQAHIALYHELADEIGRNRKH